MTTPSPIAVQLPPEYRLILDNADTQRTFGVNNATAVVKKMLDLYQAGRLVLTDTSTEEMVRLQLDAKVAEAIQPAAAYLSEAFKVAGLDVAETVLFEALRAAIGIENATWSYARLPIALLEQVRNIQTTDNTGQQFARIEELLEAIRVQMDAPTAP